MAASASTCAECGAALERGAATCPHCGVAPPRRGRLPLWLVVGAVVVVALVTVLVALGSHDAREVDHARRDAAGIQLEGIEQALDVYYLRHGVYPDALQTLVEAKLLRARQLRDPWRHPLAYRRTGPRAFEVCSRGADEGEPTDDICIRRDAEGDR